jgi:hypothetical protein
MLFRFLQYIPYKLNLKCEEMRVKHFHLIGKGKFCTRTCHEGIEGGTGIALFFL